MPVRRDSDRIGSTCFALSAGLAGEAIEGAGDPAPRMRATQGFSPSEVAAAAARITPTPDWAMTATT
ncbi:hypothetical protein [Streptomyces sp. HPF1205]|uniref:hypothetical protein n=1 Tax=Streptomyces sp. HPF1205 TaxID=2873262 RepID=UPI001CEDCE7E|nr:hypothetical protein [Streptomyces sp. HPF1205]